MIIWTPNWIHYLGHHRILCDLIRSELAWPNLGSLLLTQAVASTFSPPVQDEGGEIVEMKDNKSGSLCCGAGGGNMWHEIPEGDRINIKRFEQAIDSQADTVATACSFCAIMMEDAKNVTGNENKMQTLDIAELVANSLDK